jgi:hypothetical protein
MEYAPLNLWPRGTPQGEYVQTTIGPYDYYAIKYGYAHISGANTPADEVPTLRRWAAAWSDPRYRYASDEDVSWDDGHAADPRSEQDDLTNDPLSWCRTQMRMDRNQIEQLNRFLPLPGSSYQDERDAFSGLLRGYLSCPVIASHYIGGQYLSRAHRGDANSQAPIVPVSRPQERRAFDLIETYLFSASALPIGAQTLQHLGYAEWAGYGYTGWEGYGNLPTWAYDPPERHDYTLTEQINATQMRVIAYLFQPLVLQRIDDNPSEATAPTMSMSDLFDWLNGAIYGNLSSSGVSTVRRNLQQQYLSKLVDVANNPEKGTPSDAQSLARLQLQTIARDAQRALRIKHDEVTTAHLQELLHKANTALK